MKRVWKGVASMAFAAAGVALSATDAQAFELGTPATQHPYRSPQNFALEFKFSPYFPAVDDAPGLTGTPFKNRFGDKPRLFFGLELDWQVVRIPHVGTLGPGLGAGLVGMTRKATTIHTNEASGDEYSLNIYPMHLSAVLRADVLWHDLGFPVVPFAKFGPAVGLWKASNSSGTSKVQLPNETKPVTGKGMSLGTNLAVGVALALDAIDTGASRNMDVETGINNTYLFFEYYWLNLNGFGSSDALYVGTHTWSAGLAFEF